MTASNTHPEQAIHTFLKSVEWPVMPEVGQALIRTLSDDDADTFTVCHIIAKDPVLTATLLRMANSAMFGLSGKVDTLARAVHVVGMTLIRARALSVCMASVTDLPLGLDRMSFWRYCMLCAGYAQWLADLCHVDDQEAWLGGMMLRLGEISLGKTQPPTLPKIEAQPIHPGERWIRQHQLLGFDEGQVTAELAQHWDFPPVLVDGLRYAAQPLANPDFSKLAAVLHLAARLADGGAITEQTLDTLPLLVMNMLQIDIAALATQLPDAEVLADISMFQH